MSAKPTEQPDPKGDKSSKESPNETVSSKGDRKVSDPHPDTEEGYDRATEVPMTGL